MRETLACALLRISGWTPDRPLHDPFCGSGTILLEAARHACGIAPGSDRSFDAEAWIGRADDWETARQAATPIPGEAVDLQISGSDRDAGAIEAARENAERAGVGERVSFTVAPVSAAPIPPDAFVVTNPPWGVRISGGDLRNLHAALGRVVREHAATGITALTDAPRFDRETGIAFDTVAATRSGGIDVKIYRSQGG